MGFFIFVAFADGAGSGMIEIIIDKRERRSGLPDILTGMAGVQLGFDWLPEGDYLVDGQLLFERKTLVDFVASIKEGRLFRQARRLAVSRWPGAIILEGTAADLAASGMRREAIQGALIHLTLFLGIPMLRAIDQHESARLMIYAAGQLRALATGALPRPGKRPRGKRRTQLYILQSLPGIGPARAAGLLEVFGSVEAVMAASVETLAAVPGVGTSTAQAIRRAVSDRHAPYLSKRDDFVI